MKELARKLGLLPLYRRLRYGKHTPKKHIPFYPWAGNYANWETAKKVAGDYSNPAILAKVLPATLAVKSGEAVYERDSVLMEVPEYPEDLIKALLLIAGESNNQLSVVDFGGSLGSSYFQTRPFLQHLKQLEWSVVEQSHFVEAGKKHIKDEHLDFYNTIDEVEITGKSVLLLSGVIQYLPEPIAFLKEQVLGKFTYIIVDRTAFIEGAPARITVQRVPKEIYDANYPAWFFPEQEFLDLFLPRYQVLASFKSFADPDLVSDDGKNMYLKCYLFKLKSA